MVIAGIREFQNRLQRAGGFAKFFSAWLRSNFRSFWEFLQSIPIFKDVLNKFYISTFLASFERTVPRIPHYTLKHDYPTMDVLYDESRTTYSRLLRRVSPEWQADLPSPEAAASLFLRDSFIPETNRNLTVLIAYYAQWFTHQFLSTNPNAHEEANTPLGINLSMMYGSKIEDERKVRSYVDGLLRATFRNGQEYPEILDIDEKSARVIPGAEMFNMPIGRANLVPGFAAIHVLFFRRHQYVARELKKWAVKNGKEMDDEEIFQKTKIIMAMIVLKITMHDYVGRSLQSSHVKIRLDRTVKKSLMWKWFGPSYYPPCNSIQVEFNFLYRWHQFIPKSMKIVKKLPAINEKTVYDVDAYETEDLNLPTVSSSDAVVQKIRKAAGYRKTHDEEDAEPIATYMPERWNSVARIVGEEDGLERVLFSAATQRAGKLELMNTDEFLVKTVVLPGIKKNREYGIASYNDYREHFGFGRVTSFEQITSNVELQRRLADVYGHVDQIEYYPGIFAEDKDLGGVHGPFLATIGTAMTFCAIHASRLFETDVVTEESLTPRGVELVDEINYLSDMTERHSELGKARIRFTMPENAKVPSRPSASVSHYHQD